MNKYMNWLRVLRGQGIKISFHLTMVIDPNKK